MGRQLKDVVGIPIASTQAGAYMRPFWYNLNFEGRDMSQVLLNNVSRTLYEDALKVVFYEQTLAGLDIFTDGCLRYDDWTGGMGWGMHLISRLGGVQWSNDFLESSRSLEGLPASEFLQEFHWQVSKNGNVVERLSAGNLQLAQFYKFASRFSRNALLRSTMPDAAITMGRLANKKGVYKDATEMLFDLVKVINSELRRLVDAGCKIIQLDYPFWPAFYQGTKASTDVWNMYVEAFNREVQGVNAQIWAHVDWGRVAGGQLAVGEVRNFDELFRRIADAKVDVVGIEAASTYGNNLERDLGSWKENCQDMDICIGAVNHRRTMVETPEEVAGIIRKALKYVPPEKLAVYNDCGLSHLPRLVAYGKIKAIVEGCKLTRKELGINASA